jgi:hypothetical protein
VFSFNFEEISFPQKQEVEKILVIALIRENRVPCSAPCLRKKRAKTAANQNHRLRLINQILIKIKLATKGLGLVAVYRTTKHAI